MKAICTFILSSLFVTLLSAQLYNTGSIIQINSGAVVYSGGTVSNTNSSLIVNNGVLISKGSIINFSASVLYGNGTYHVGENWVNTSVFDAGTSTFIFEGTEPATSFTNDDAFNILRNEKVSANLTLLDPNEVTNSLTFASTNSKIILGAHNLILSSSAPINNPDASNYIVTNGDGALVKKNQTGNFLYPIGNAPGSYTPITINQAGTADDLSARALGGVFEDGQTGTIVAADNINVSWEVLEATAGGSDLTLTPQWNASNELVDFDRNNSSVHNYNAGWVAGPNFGPAGGADPYTHVRASITEGGIFTVAGPNLESGVLLDLHVVLEGAYDAGMMVDELRALSDFPTTEPYTDLGFTHYFRGGGEVIDVSQLTNQPIVDWVFVELRDANTPATVVATKSAILLTSGKVVDLDGVSDLLFDGVASGNYFVAIKHRNHIGVMSETDMALSRTIASLDFSTGGALFGGSNDDVQKDLTGGVFGLYAGDLNTNGIINAADRSESWNNRNVTGYNTADSVMDGVVDAKERSQTWNNRNRTTFIPQ